MQNNPLSLALENMKQAGVSILDLTESNPTQCGFNYPATWLEGLSNSSALTYAPEAKGMLKARQAVAGYYTQRNSSIDPEHLVLTSSTSEGYSFLLKLLTNPGDHVLIPKPSYPLFQFLLELHDVDFDYYPLTYDGTWKIDQKAFKNLVTAKTKAVILVNPNNPTGSYISFEDIAFLNEQCVKNQMAIISDEVFLDYRLSFPNASVGNPEFGPPSTTNGSPRQEGRTFGGDSGSLVDNTKALTFVLSGISKILGVPQMKLSWIAINGPQATVQVAIDRLEIIADTYLSVNTPVQNALSTWLAGSHKIQKQILERVQGNLEVLRRGMINHARTLSVEGGWYAVIDAPSIVSEEDFILDLLQTEHVLVHPGYFFDFDREGYLVLSLLPKPEVFAQALEKISRKM